MDAQKIRQLLRPYFWDYDLDPYEIFEVIMNERERAGSFTRETALIRLLERLSWYEIIQLLGWESLKTLLTQECIAKLRFPELQARYEFARKILHGEPVSFSGWSPEYRQKIQRTLLSHRWYRTQPGVLSV